MDIVLLLLILTDSSLLVPNALLKYLYVLVVQTYKDDSVSKELKDMVLFYILMQRVLFPLSPGDSYKSFQSRNPGRKVACHPRSFLLVLCMCERFFFMRV